MTVKIIAQYCDNCLSKLYYVSKRDGQFVCSKCEYRQPVRTIV